MRVLILGTCSLLLMFVSLLLASCGGGGDAGGETGGNTEAPFLAIDQDNATEAAEAAVGALEAVSGTVVSVEDIDDVAVEGNTARVATAAVLERTVTCPNGGTVHVVIDVDLEGILQGPSPGNTSSFGFDACARPGNGIEGAEVTMDGGLEYVVTQASGSLLSGTYDYTYVYTFNDFQLSEAGGNVWAAEGGLTVQVQSDGENQTSYVVSTSSFTVTEAGAIRSLSAFEFDFTMNTAPDSFEATAQGTLFSSELGGSVAFATIIPLTGTSEEPTNGAIKITGADNSSVTVLIEDSVVTLEVDADGDGAVDTTIPVTWEELES